MAAAKAPWLKGNLSSIKPPQKDWLETIGETYFYKVDGAAYYGQSLKGTKTV